MQPKTADYWPTNLQVAICSLTQPFLEKQQLALGFVILSDHVDHAECVIEHTGGRRELMCPTRGSWVRNSG